MLECHDAPNKSNTDKADVDGAQAEGVWERKEISVAETVQARIDGAAKVTELSKEERQTGRGRIVSRTVMLSIIVLTCAVYRR